MSKISSKNTAPEVIIRKILHSMGYRFRLHQKNLPGTPDIVLKRHQKIVLVNGCFWHGHENCKRSKLPETNKDKWEAKIQKNKLRDEHNLAELKVMGWDVLVIWQCQLRDREKLMEQISSFMTNE